MNVPLLKFYKTKKKIEFLERPRGNRRLKKKLP
jgi:hypothetical protein